MTVAYYCCCYLYWSNKHTAYYYCYWHYYYYYFYYYYSDDIVYNKQADNSQQLIFHWPSYPLSTLPRSIAQSNFIPDHICMSWLGVYYWWSFGKYSLCVTSLLLMGLTIELIIMNIYDIWWVGVWKGELSVGDYLCIVSKFES